MVQLSKLLIKTTFKDFKQERNNTKTLNKKRIKNEYHKLVEWSSKEMVQQEQEDKE